MNIRHFELVAEAEKFLGENFNGLKLIVPVEFNTRIKSVFGRVIIRKTQGKVYPTKIEVSINFIKNHPKETILDVFRHELVHYALIMNEKPYEDGHPYFEGELKRLGVSSTRTYTYYGELHQYKCKNCGQVHTKKRKLNIKITRCNCSPLEQNLVYEGVVTVAASGEAKK